mmetsp:Transcript_24451/g.39121  ORF Transcript_24451/g.39121 Transcript_24451/m.39121 type:complete len:317 (+) Transcript_24451:515-1465(+)
MQFQHHGESVFRWLHSRGEHISEELLSQWQISSSPASLEEMSENHLIWSIPVRIHILEYEQSLLEVLNVNVGFNQHRISHDGRLGAAIGRRLQSFIDLYGLWQAGCVNEALDEEVTSTSIKSTTFRFHHANNVIDAISIFLGNTNLEESGQRHIIWLQLVQLHLLEAFKAFLNIACNDEALDHGIVGNRIDNSWRVGIIIAMTFEEKLQRAFRLVALYGSVKKQIHHQGGCLTLQFFEEALCLLKLACGGICSKYRHIVANLKVALLVAANHGYSLLLRSMFKSGIDEARKDDFVVRQDMPVRCKNMQAARKVLAA